MPLGKAAIGGAIAVVGLLLTMLTAGVLTSNQAAPSSAIILAANLGVYTDSACTSNCTAVSAGTLAPGSSKTYTVYVKNKGTAPMTLSMITSEWNPKVAHGPITLTWNRENYSLTAGDSIGATLTLAVSSSIDSSINSFSFNIAITGTG